MSDKSVKFDEDGRHAVYERDGYKCVYCGYHDRLKTGDGMSIDHITARENGGEGQAGKHDPKTNCITACVSCNSSKQAKTNREFNAYLKGAGAPPPPAESKVRAMAARRLDIAAGERNAAAARAWRAQRDAAGGKKLEHYKAERLIWAQEKLDAAKAAHEAATKTHAPPAAPAAQVPPKQDGSQTEQKTGPPQDGGGLPSSKSSEQATQKKSGGNDPPAQKDGGKRDKAPEKTGPGIRHGDDGKFKAGRARGFDRANVCALIQHFATVQGLAARGWKFAVEMVPGLLHNGEPAWATVETPEDGSKVARVRVRDLLVTPLPAADLWTELKLTIAHEMGHVRLTDYLSNPTGEAEEELVEEWAQQLVRPSADAAVLARAWAMTLKDAPRLRARLAKISARASSRARGGTMDPKVLQEALDALIAGEADKCAEILKKLVVSAASGGGEPDGDEGGDALPPAPPAAREEPKPDPGTGGAGAMARKMTVHEARARKAADTASGVAVRARLREVEIVDGVKLPENLRAELAKMTDVDAFERRIGDITAGRALSTARARSGDTTPTAPAGAGGGPAPKYDAAKLIAEGIHPIMAAQIASESDAAIAGVALAAARARVASATPPWPTTGAKGGAS